MVRENQTPQAALSQKIEQREACVAVLGMGYVGLPLALEFVRGGFPVYGVDVDRDRVASLNDGASYIPDVTDADVQAAVATGRFTATADFAVLEEADAVSICVPTPLRKTKDPDISYILVAIDEVCSRLRPPQVIVLESTTYPGTTEELLLPRVQEEQGAHVGENVFLAFSPERVDPGNKVFTTRNTPKIVGGVTDQCTQMACQLYRSVLDTVVPVSSARVAEMVKLLENTFRAVNIGLVNEVLLMCEVLGIDVWEVISAAATKPFGFMPFYPGPGLGGACLPVDPHYLSWKLKTLNYHARFIELATEVNASMPPYVVSRIADALNEDGKAINGSTVLIIGLAYKKDVGDLRESPALDILKLLSQKGATLWFNDPFVQASPLGEVAATYVELTPEVLEQCDCAVVVTDHSVYDYHVLAKHAPLLIDTRNATKDVPRGVGRVVKL
ncbi:MAG: nucleotide sugar dehydrogenase [bacterium]|nr:nucleotide sugar dehydrogenase [bacterium]